MMSKEESTRVWAPLKRALDALRWDYQRIEDKLTPGIPDVNILVPRQGEVWVELKHCAAPGPKGTVAIGLRKEQFIWMRDGKKAGRKVYLFARVGQPFYCWQDEASWEAAKHPTDWQSLLRKAHRFNDAGAFLAKIQQP
jgi:hypothetical protein